VASGVGRIAKQHSVALQPHPVRSQRRRRQAEHQRVRRLQPALDGQLNVVSRLDVEPNAQLTRAAPSTCGREKSKFYQLVP
jgi:hypothetical protein